MLISDLDILHVASEVMKEDILLSSICWNTDLPAASVKCVGLLYISHCNGYIVCKEYVLLEVTEPKSAVGMVTYSPI